MILKEKIENEKFSKNDIVSLIDDEIFNEYLRSLKSTWEDLKKAEIGIIDHQNLKSDELYKKYKNNEVGIAYLKINKKYTEYVITIIENKEGEQNAGQKNA